MIGYDRTVARDGVLGALLFFLAIVGAIVRFG